MAQAPQGVAEEADLYEGGRNSIVKKMDRAHLIWLVEGSPICFYTMTPVTPATAVMVEVRIKDKPHFTVVSARYWADHGAIIRKDLESQDAWFRVAEGKDLGPWDE